ELDFIQEALETSKAAAAPVKVIWSREDDIRNAQYRPVNHHRLQAGLDASGRPVVWTHRIVAPSIMARAHPHPLKKGRDEEAGWGTPPPAGRSRGIAVYKAFESYVAEVAEVSVASDGAVQVHRVVCAVDCGPVVNPSIVEAQMESAIVFGLTAALYGEIAIE